MASDASVPVRICPLVEGIDDQLTLGDVAFDSTTDLKTKIHKVRDNLRVLPGEPVPLAVGFIGWILDTTEKSEDPRIPAALDERPSAIWLAFGADLTPHIAAVRAHDEKSGRTTLIFVQVGTVADALRYAPLVDFIVVQGELTLMDL